MTPCQSSSDDEDSITVVVVIRLVYMDRFDTPCFDDFAGASEMDSSVSESDVFGACVADVVWPSSSDDRSDSTGAVLRARAALAGLDPLKAEVAVECCPTLEGVVLVRLIAFW